MGDPIAFSQGEVIVKNILAVLVLTLLTACATTYQPQAFTGGYSQTQLAENVFKVTFKGNAHLDRETASDYALLRSAEVTLENGFKYFVIVDAQQYSKNLSYTTPTTTYGSAYGNGGYAQGIATTYGGQSFLFSKPTSTNVIICLNEKPDSFVYEAEFIVRSIKQKYQMR
jgi:hypothetical protein